MVARIAMLEQLRGSRERQRFHRPIKEIRDRIAMTQLTHCHAAQERAAFPWQDLAIVLGATVLAALVCMRIEFAERVFDFSRNWEHWQVDELGSIARAWSWVQGGRPDLHMRLTCRRWSTTRSRSRHSIARWRAG